MFSNYLVSKDESYFALIVDWYSTIVENNVGVIHLSLAQNFDSNVDESGNKNVIGCLINLLMVPSPMAKILGLVPDISVEEKGKNVIWVQNFLYFAPVVPYSLFFFTSQNIFHLSNPINTNKFLIRKNSFRRKLVPNYSLVDFDPILLFYLK